jgi:hypothetical protein
VVGQVIGPLGKEHREFVTLDQRHQHGRAHGWPFVEASLDLDLGRPSRRRGKAPTQRLRRQARRRHWRQVVVGPEYRKRLRIEAQGHGAAPR